VEVKRNCSSLQRGKKKKKRIRFQEKRGIALRFKTLNPKNGWENTIHCLPAEKLFRRGRDIPSFRGVKEKKRASTPVLFTTHERKEKDRSVKVRGTYNSCRGVPIRGGKEKSQVKRGGNFIGALPKEKRKKKKKNEAWTEKACCLDGGEERKRKKKRKGGKESRAWGEKKGGAKGERERQFSSVLQEEESR